MLITRPTTLAAAILLAISLVDTSAAQELTTSLTAPKVRPRFFDPFNVNNRFTLSPFGTFGNSGTTFVSPFATSGGAAISQEPIADEEGESDEPIFVSLVLPPPYVPPVRSPYRPLPRPPFIP
jgi:hypothetical protein